MTKQKVLIVVHQLNVGGVQKALLSALDAIDYQHNDVTLYIRKDRLDLLPSVNPNVSKIIVNKDKTLYYRKPFSVLLIGLSLIMKCLGRRDNCFHRRLVEYILNCQYKYEQRQYFQDDSVFDVVVSYIQGYTAQFVAKYIKAKRKIMFFHGSTDETHELHEGIMGEFSSIYCVSEGALKELQRLYPQFAGKMKCLENIVDVEKVRQEAKAFVINKPEEKIVLCSCGRFTPVKGYDLAVEAAKSLKEKGLPFIWYFVGDGPERNSLELLISQYGLSDQIVIIGMLLNPHPYMAACDIYVQPSREEAQGLTMLEAQILLRPVVSTRTVGGQSLVQDGVNGILTDVNTSSLAEGIERLAGDDHLRMEMEMNLKNMDYSEKERVFKEQWAALLEGNNDI